MTSADDRPKQPNGLRPTDDAEALRRCERADDLVLRGEYDEARVLLTEALRGATEIVWEAEIVTRLANVEFAAGRHNDALAILTEHAPLFDERVSHAVRGSFHNLLALVLKQLGFTEGRPDYLDRAIIEFTAAIHHRELAGDERFRAASENDLAGLLRGVGRYEQAHEHLDRADAALRGLDDAGLLGYAEETRAAVFLAEKKYEEADRVVARAVRTFEQTGAAGPLADALVTQGVARARLGDAEGSLGALRRAVRVAEEAGALRNAAVAALTLIEEHGARETFPPQELYELYLRADRMLKDTQHPETVARLRACARLVMRRLSDVRFGEEDFTFFGAVHEFEERIIEQALEESRGSIVKAAKLLGLRHQTFSSMLNQRHQKLTSKRKPRQKRRRSIIKKDS